MSSYDNSPEILRPRFELDGEDNELNDLIRGMSELANATGRVSSTQFAADTLEQMKAQGIEDSYREKGATMIDSVKPLPQVVDDIVNGLASKLKLDPLIS